MTMSRQMAALVTAAILTALTIAMPAQASTRGSQGRAQAGRIM